MVQKVIAIPLLLISAGQASSLMEAYSEDHSQFYTMGKKGKINLDTEIEMD